MASAKTIKTKKPAVSRTKALQKAKPAARRAPAPRKTATARKPAARTATTKNKPVRAKATPKTTAKKIVKAPVKSTAVKKPVKKVELKKTAKMAAVASKTVAKTATSKVAAPKAVISKAAAPKVPASKAPASKPVMAESVKKMMKVKAEAAQKQKDKADKEAAKIQAKPVATVHKFMPRAGAPAMGAKPFVQQPQMKMSTFSTTASPAKSAGNSKIGFKVNEYIVYPTHGVGQITAIEEQLIAGLKLELFVVFFAKDRMTLRVPVGKIASVGLRKISDTGLVAKAMETLKGRPRIKRTMWSRRAQEYEAKINSGDLIAVAEVVRDLFRADTQPEQSYSERQLFEAALDRMVREVAVVHKSSDTEAQHMIETSLQKSPRRTRAVATGDENVVAFKKADNDDDGMEETQAA